MTLSDILSIIASLISLISLGRVLKIQINISSKNSNKLKQSGISNEAYLANKDITIVHNHGLKIEELDERLKTMEMQILQQANHTARRISNMNN